MDLEAWVELERRASAEFDAAYEEARSATGIARSLAGLRIRRGFSQAEVARKLGTSQQAISRMERSDYRGHTLRMIRRYAAALGVDVEVRLVPRDRKRPVGVGAKSAAGRKNASVRAAAPNSLPAEDVGTMLADIEAGYGAEDG